MNFAPEEIAEIKARAIKQAADQLHRAVLGEMDDQLGRGFLVPIQLAAALLGCSPTYAKTILPTVDLGQRPTRVAWGDLLDTIEARREVPDRALTLAER